MGLITHLEAASFVSTFYRLYNAKLETDGPALKICLDDEVAKKLDGPWARGYDLEFVFREEDLTQKESAELVTLGSHRFHYLVQLAVKKGLFVKVALSPQALPQAAPTAATGCRYYHLGSALSYRPCLAITFSFGFQGERRWEEIHTFLLDRVSGWISMLTWNKLFPYIEQPTEDYLNRLDKAALSLNRSYQQLQQAAILWLANNETKWTEDARTKLQAEEQELNEYYEKRFLEEASKNPDVEAQLRRIWQIRLKEQQDRFAPKVFIQPLQFALMAVPLVQSTYLQIDAGGEKKVRFMVSPFQSVLAD